MEPYIIFGTITFLSGGFFGFIIGTGVGLKMGLRTKPEEPNPVPGLLFMVGGLIALILSICSIVYSIFFISNSETTNATVVEIRETKNDEGEISRHPLYRYQSITGQEYTDTTSTSDGREFKVGDTIPIRYLAKSPQSSRIDYFAYHWMLPIILGIVAVALTLVGVVLNWNFKRKSKLLLTAKACS